MDGVLFIELIKIFPFKNLLYIIFIILYHALWTMVGERSYFRCTNSAHGLCKTKKFDQW